jgi:hypothetical protein
MKRILLPALILVTSCALQAKDKPAYQNGILIKMDSASYGSEEKGGSTVTGEILDTDGQHKKTQELLCQEYTLQTDRLVYRIRAKNEKHPALLPIGETAQFRLHKDRQLLRVPEADGKERFIPLRGPFGPALLAQLLRPLLTSATGSETISRLSVSNSRPVADLPR